jgi:integrase
VASNWKSTAHTLFGASAVGIPGAVLANVKAVQRMLGHAKASMTLDTYADLFDEDLDEVADRLNDAIRVTADALRTAEVP